MNTHYNQNYLKGDIDKILKKIQDCIKEGKFSMELNENRQENIGFINEYNLKTERQKEILLSIATEDFCHSLQNTKIGYTHEILYVFCPQVLLLDIFANDKIVDIYIKFNIIEYNATKRVVTISFHERNKPITYCFDR